MAKGRNPLDWPGFIFMCAILAFVLAVLAKYAGWW